jgi:hypothetical protein
VPIFTSQTATLVSSPCASVPVHRFRSVVRLSRDHRRPAAGVDGRALEDRLDPRDQHRGPLEGDARTGRGAFWLYGVGQTALENFS